MEYTEGRWYKIYDRENDSYHIYARQEKASYIWLAEIEGEANAQLIASAPDLYEACKGLISDGVLSPRQHPKYYDRIILALRKAGGK